MATWPVDVAQSAALASGDPRDERAPAVAAGALLGNSTNSAISEEANRKRLRAVDPNSVTEAEVQALLAAIQANAAVTRAAIRNLRRRELNRNGTWTHVLVETAGPNPIGFAPQNHPQSQEEVLRMTGAQITALEASFNLDACSFNGGDLAARRNAVLNYLYEG